MSSNWYIYLIKCSDESLYIGITTDVQRRFSEHSFNRKKAAKYVRGRRPLLLLSYYLVGSKSDALKTEIKLKKLPKIKKIEHFDQNK